MVLGDESRDASSIEQVEFKRLQEVIVHKIQLVTDEYSGSPTVDKGQKGLREVAELYVDDKRLRELRVEVQGSSRALAGNVPGQVGA